MEPTKILAAILVLVERFYGAGAVDAIVRWLGAMADALEAGDRSTFEKLKTKFCCFNKCMPWGGCPGPNCLTDCMFPDPGDCTCDD